MGSDFLKSQILIAFPTQTLALLPLLAEMKVFLRQPTRLGIKDLYYSLVPAHPRQKKKNACPGHGLRSSQEEVIDLCLQGSAALAQGGAKAFQMFH